MKWSEWSVGEEHKAVQDQHHDDTTYISVTDEYEQYKKADTQQHQWHRPPSPAMWDAVVRARKSEEQGLHSSLVVLCPQ